MNPDPVILEPTTTYFTVFEEPITTGTGTTASTVDIEGAPTGGTLTNSYALNVQDGRIRSGDQTESTSTTSGSLILSGGAGIAGNLHVGGAIYGKVYDSTVKSFGAVGDGVADDTAAIQAAFDNLDYVVFPPGTYKITAQINVTRGDITVQGNHATLVKDDLLHEAALKFNGGAAFKMTIMTIPIDIGDNVITLHDATGLKEGDWLLLASSQNWYYSGGWAPRSNLVEVESVSGNVVKLHTPILVPITKALTVHCYRPIRNIYVNDLTFRSSTTIPVMTVGTGPIGLSLTTVADARVSNCVFQHFYNRSIESQNAFRIDCIGCKFFGIPDGFVMEWSLSGGMGYYGHVAHTCYGVNTLNCYGYRVRHLTDGARTTNHRTSNCSSIAHHRSVVRMHGQNINAIVTDNWGYSTIGDGILGTCTPFLLISGNHFIMTSGDIEASLIGDNTTTPADPSDSYLSLRYPSVITNNILETNPANNVPTIVLGNFYSSLVVSGNICRNCATGLEIRSLYLESCVISDNIFESANIATADGILFSSNQYIRKRDNITICNNIARNYGRSGIRFHASTIPSSRTNTLKIKNNVLDAVNSTNSSPGVYIDSGYFGVNVVIQDNCVLNTRPGGQLITMTNRTYFERTPYITYQFTDQPKLINAASIVGYGTNSTLPAGTTIEHTSMILNTLPAPGSAAGWLCTTGGTYGTLSGVTATTNGTTTVILTGNTAKKVGQGTWITVNGSQVRVVNMSDDFVTAVVSTPVAAATGVAVSYRNPILIEFARVSNKVGAYSALTSATNERATTTDVSAVSTAVVASKLSNLIADLQAAGIIG